MKRAGFAGKPLAIGLGAVLTGGLETAVESTAAEVMPSSDAGYLDVGGAAPQTAKPGDWGGIELTLTPLQRMIQDILDPLALETRAVREWRNLYRSFFSFFAPNGAADETERRAWAIAAEVFNTNLVAVANRTTQVVPMTFQDFLDGVDSFRHDGLREGAHRDIAWQPKKTLLLMAAMIGRVVAGWQADAGLAPDPPRDLFPFRNHLIEENRKASFLGSVFGYDPRFSILEYGAARLETLAPGLSSFRSCAHGKWNLPMRVLRAPGGRQSTAPAGPFPEAIAGFAAPGLYQRAGYGSPGGPTRLRPAGATIPRRQARTLNPRAGRFRPWPSSPPRPRRYGARKQNGFLNWRSPVVCSCAGPSGPRPRTRAGSPGRWAARRPSSL